MSSLPLLVTGATGNVGGACAHHLLRAGGVSVRCLVRDATSEKALALKEAGAALFVGDFSDAASLAAALDGVNATLLACSNQPEQIALEEQFISSCASQNKYIVKLSTCGCPGYCTADSAIEYGRFHAAIEATLEATTGIQFTILQPNDYMSNHMGDIFGTLPHNLLAYPRTASQLADGKARIVDVRDVGEIAAKLLLDGISGSSQHHGRRYHVCGPASFSVRGLASLYEQALGLAVGTIHCVADMSEATYATNLEQNAGFPQWLAVAVACNQMFWAEGKLDYASSDEVMALHPNFRTMEAWATEHAPLVKRGE